MLNIGEYYSCSRRLEHLDSLENRQITEVSSDLFMRLSGWCRKNRRCFTRALWTMTIKIISTLEVQY